MYSLKTIIVISNHPSWTYSLRGELLEALVNDGNRVIVVVGYGKRIEDIKAIGCEFIDVPIDRHGKNLFEEFKLFSQYRKLLKSIKPDIVLTYTIKPNLYGGFLCRLMNIPCIANITGLGTAVEYDGLLQKLLLEAYKIAFKKMYLVMFQNTVNRDMFKRYKIVKDNYLLLPGSGVNVNKFSVLPMPNGNNVGFVFISRIMKEKGIEQYLYAAHVLKEKYPWAMFHICGFCEQAYESTIDEYSRNGIVINHGMVDDVREVLKLCHCLVLPSYYPEGLSNVLLESAASGRAIITTNRPGCKEVIDDGINGYVVQAQDNEDVLQKMERFINLPMDKIKEMGMAGRKKVEISFNRQIVIDKYLASIHKI